MTLATNKSVATNTVFKVQSMFNSFNLHNISVQLARFAIWIIATAISTTVYANYNDIEVNGKTINPEIFSAFEAHALADSDYCTPFTEDYVIHQIVQRVLIRDAARASNLQGYRDDATEEAEKALKAQIEQLPENTDPEMKSQLALWLLAAESDNYLELMTPLFIEAPRDRYMQLLEKNDPLIVNVPVVKTAALRFDSFTEANETMNRIKTKEEFNTIRKELGFNNLLHIKKSEIWRHAAELRYAKGNNDYSSGQLLGPLFAEGDWRVVQILESKKLPVALLGDTFGEAETSIDSMIQLRLKNEKEHTYITELWSRANVMNKGKPLTMSNEIEHCLRAK